MFNQDFEKILDLVKKTGDKIVVMPEFAAPFVVVPFEQYESLLTDRIDYGEMSEEEILHKVNRDIALWKQSQRDLGLADDIDYVENCTLWNKPSSQSDEAGEWLLDDFTADEETTPKDEKDNSAIVAPWKKDWSSEFKTNNLVDDNQEEVVSPVEDLQTEIIKNDVKTVFAYEDVPPPPPLIKKDLPVIDVNNEDIVDVWEEEEMDEEESGHYCNLLGKREEKDNTDEFLVEPIE